MFSPDYLGEGFFPVASKALDAESLQSAAASIVAHAAGKFGVGDEPAHGVDEPADVGVIAHEQPGTLEQSAERAEVRLPGQVEHRSIR